MARPVCAMNFRFFSLFGHNAEELGTFHTQVHVRTVGLLEIIKSAVGLATRSVAAAVCGTVSRL